MKPWLGFLKKLALPAAAAVLLPWISGCDQNDTDHWKTYDASGHPVGGVLILCSYGLPSSDKAGVNYRFSDASGKVVLDLDKDIPRGLDQAHVCVYSRELKNGDLGLGERWHDGQPVPATPAYFDEWNNKIFISRTAEDDASARHAALEILIAKYSVLRRFPNGGAKLGTDLRSFVTRERDEFLANYGAEPVPPAYYTSPTFRNFHDSLPATPAAGLTFKDITLDLPTP